MLAAVRQILVIVVGIDFGGVPGGRRHRSGDHEALIGWSIVEAIALLAFSGPS